MSLIKSIRNINVDHQFDRTDPRYKIDLYTDRNPEVNRTQGTREYQLVASLAYNQVISIEMIQDSDQSYLDYAIDNMKEAVVDSVYGELQKDLVELMYITHSELFDVNPPTGKSLEKIREIIKKITL
jgi:hypothetical protein